MRRPTARRLPCERSQCKTKFARPVILEPIPSEQTDILIHSATASAARSSYHIDVPKQINASAALPYCGLTVGKCSTRLMSASTSPSRASCSSSEVTSDGKLRLAV
jgi:hypothetical protein